ncbi:MAG: pyridoxal-phosphate dependent enzyme, partial [Myxococcales bacterium]|nr:pyridoxal-phosphate dependent enzyme [Myxococcales bacterium]
MRHRGLDLLEDDALIRPVPGRVIGEFGDYEDKLLKVPMHRNGVELWAKCEFTNPAGSVKDRPALRIISDALARGDLSGRRLIDSTSGNTGIAYSMVGAALGVPVTLVMLEAVRDFRDSTGRQVGVKPAGGIRTSKDAI